MQIKKPLSVVCYSIFLIYSWVFGEYLSAAGLNEIYEAIVVIGLFFINIFFTIWMNNLDENIYKTIRIPFILLWTLVTMTFSRIVVLPLSKVLMLSSFEFLLYFLFIVCVSKVREHKSLKEIIAPHNKKKMIVVLIIVYLVVIFILFKTYNILVYCNKSIMGYFVEYKQNSILGFDMEYYPTFSYVINGETYINDTDNPMLIRIYKPEKENKVKLLYNEEDPNQIVIKSHVVLNIVAVFAIGAGTIAILYVYNKNKFENKNEGE